MSNKELKPTPVIANELFKDIDLTFGKILSKVSPDDIARFNDLFEELKEEMLQQYNQITTKLLTHIIFTEHPVEEIFKEFINDSQQYATNVINYIGTGLKGIRIIEINKKEHIKNGTSIDE